MYKEKNDSKISIKEKKIKSKKGFSRSCQPIPINKYPPLQTDAIGLQSSITSARKLKRQFWKPQTPCEDKLASHWAMTQREAITVSSHILGILGGYVSHWILIKQNYYFSYICLCTWWMWWTCIGAWETMKQMLSVPMHFPWAHPGDSSRDFPHVLPLA